MKAASHLVMFRWLLRRELILAWRRKSDVMSMLAFFVIIASLFPLGVDPDSRLLRNIAPGVVWISALLASMLGLGSLFSSDYTDGTLEQMWISPQPRILIVAGKILAQCLLTGTPLVLISPLLALQFGLSSSEMRLLAVSLLTGIPVLNMIGAIGSALTIGVRGGGLVVALIVLPLCVPVLVFGAGRNVPLVGAVLALTLVFAPWAAASALGIVVED
jgi:heme exporter protein B